MKKENWFLRGAKEMFRLENMTGKIKRAGMILAVAALAGNMSGVYYAAAQEITESIHADEQEVNGICPEDSYLLLCREDSYVEI